MILTAATMVVKIIGMFYKIPLGNILGAVGMSYFMTAYNIFNPVYALSVAGLPVAVSKMAAESVAQKRFRETKKIFDVSFWLFVITGVVGTALMLFGADAAAMLVRNPDAALSIRAISPAIFFCCLISAYRGYYQGLSNMTPTAVSQVLESVFKLVCGIVFALYFYRAEVGKGLLAGMSRTDAELAALPYAASGAILGVTVSVVVGAAYLMLLHAAKKDGITRGMLEASPDASGTGKIIRRLAALALPVCIGSILTQITALIDVATIMNRVSVAISRGGDAVVSMYAAHLPTGVTAEELPNFLYGAYSYCASLFNLVPALTIPLGISILPRISSHWALGQRAHAASQVQSLIKFSSLLAIPAGLGLTALAQPILELLYPARLSEIVVAAPLLRSLGIAAAFVGVTAPINSVFQAMGRADIPVKLMAMGAGVKLAMNYFLIAMPHLNINAAPYGTIACYFFILIASLVSLQNLLGVELNLAHSFFKPLFCGGICAFSAFFAHDFLKEILFSRALCLISIGIGGIIYLVFVILFKVITKNEYFLLPNGTKIVKTLEKLCLLR